jgi:predicted transcriptional regulator of viral defense system
MHLEDYIEKLQKEGTLCFAKEDALKTLGIGSVAFKAAANYLVRKKMLASAKSNFFIIVPPKYREWGIIPAEQFIGPLMAHLMLPYYVGLLSAAELHGAGHHRPQEYHIVVEGVKKKMTIRGLEIAFFTGSSIGKLPTQRMAVRTGYIAVSTPEVTALDLVKYYKRVGFLDNVGTVLADLVGKMSSRALLRLVKQGFYNIAVVQRLGCLLSHEDVGGGG